MSGAKYGKIDLFSCCCRVSIPGIHPLAQYAIKLMFWVLWCCCIRSPYTHTTVNECLNELMQPADQLLLVQDAGTSPYG